MLRGIFIGTPQNSLITHHIISNLSLGSRSPQAGGQSITCPIILMNERLRITVELGKRRLPIADFAIALKKRRTLSGAFTPLRAPIGLRP